jgi:transposase
MTSTPESTLKVSAWVGIDWADKEHAVSLQAEGSSPVERTTLIQEPEALQNWIVQLRTRFAGAQVAVALEQSRGPLLYALMGTDFLVLYPINPKTLAKYREALYPSGAKDDPNDADLLRDLIQKHAQRLHPWLPEDPPIRQLRLAVEYRRHLVNEQTQLTNQLTSHLKSYFPQALNWVGNLDSVQACDFLERWPSLEVLQKTSPGKIEKFYRLHHCHPPQLIEERLQQIKKAKPLTRDPALLQTVTILVHTKVKQLRIVMESIQEFEGQIKNLFAQHPDHDVFDSFPGAGPALGPRLLSAFGTDRHHFKDAGEIQKFSGIAPITKRSGQMKVVRMRLACPHFLKQTFHEYAGQSVLRSTWAKQYYDLKKSQNMKHHAILREIAYRWIRIMFRCWQNHTPYEEQKYLNALQKRHRPLEVSNPHPV